MTNQEQTSFLRLSNRTGNTLGTMTFRVSASHVLYGTQSSGVAQKDPITVIYPTRHLY